MLQKILIKVKRVKKTMNGVREVGAVGSELCERQERVGSLAACGGTFSTGPPWRDVRKFV